MASPNPDRIARLDALLERWRILEKEEGADAAWDTFEKMNIQLEAILDEGLTKELPEKYFPYGYVYGPDRYWQFLDDKERKDHPLRYRMCRAFARIFDALERIPYWIAIPVGAGILLCSILIVIWHSRHR